MIAPDIEVVGLDPEGYAWLCDAIAARQGREGSWLWARHDGERLLATVPEVHENDPRLENLDLASPQAAAEELFSRLAPARVVLVDERQRRPLAEGLDRAGADHEISQWEFFRRCQAAFWNSPAIATAPDAPSDRWPEVANALRTAGELEMVLLVLDPGGALFLGLRASVRGGLVVRLTAAAPEQDPAPRDIDALIAGLDAVAPADIVLACHRDSLEAAFRDLDLVSAVAGLASSGSPLFTRGLERLGPLLRTGVGSP